MDGDRWYCLWRSGFSVSFVSYLLPHFSCNDTDVIMISLNNKITNIALDKEFYEQLQGLAYVSGIQQATSSSNRMDNSMLWHQTGCSHKPHKVNYIHIYQCEVQYYDGISSIMHFILISASPCLKIRRELEELVNYQNLWIFSWVDARTLHIP